MKTAVAWLVFDNAFPPLLPKTMMIQYMIITIIGILLYFGYTKCSDICPTSLSFMTQALNELDDEELKKVLGVFVRVDCN